MDWMHITPIKGLHLTEHLTQHMVLPDPLSRYEDYYTFYVQRKRNNSDFLIMDNGAFENGGRPLDRSRLMGLAALLQVNEIVIPDTMKDSRTTQRQFRDWQEAYPLRSDYLWSAVVQGKTDEEARNHMYWLVGQVGIQTICLPKLLVDIRPTLRAELAEMIHDIRPGLNIHFLGLHHAAPNDFALVKELVRSCDTSLAAVAALNDVRLDWTLDIKKLSSRPSYFWTKRMSEEKLALLNTNIQIMQDWVT